ncbi:hypothetical protein CANINC_000333 [Pichia inconspicua]|uniref:Mitochondrial thiamine pyrophosphate carrier 1 n=1 Tax=Pichia inconspicua TaxID=52247 RepID=A0A4T0X6J4_9ASCO|nr:hypothetical protein CANINC_000333 [[Candida] inconspicua]
MSSLPVETVAGLAAGFGTTPLAHPLDLLKLRLQLDTHRTSQWQACKRILSSINKNGNGTLVNLYRGIGPNIIGSTSAWGLYFFFYRHYKDLLIANSHSLENDNYLQPHHYLGTAFAAGASTAILTNPIWVVKTRMLATDRSSPGAYTSFLNGLYNIYKLEGLRGYYRGLVPALLSVSQGAVQLSLYDIIKKSLGPDNDTSSIHYLYASALSKMVATCIFYPLQTIRSRLQASTTHAHNSPISVLLNIVRYEGPLAVYKGLPANLLRVVPATCTTFLIYEHVKSNLVNIL